MASNEWADRQSREIARELYERQRRYAPLFNFEPSLPWDELDEDYKYLLALTVKDLIAHGVISVPL